MKNKIGKILFVLIVTLSFVSVCIMCTKIYFEIKNDSEWSEKNEK